MRLAAVPLLCLVVPIVGCATPRELAPPSLSPSLAEACPAPVASATPARRNDGHRPPVTRNVVLIAIDGTRWQEIFLGVDPQRGRDAGVPIRSATELLPNLHRMIARGVALGSPSYEPAIAASGPEFVSLPGYKELLSGRPATRCTSNRCPPMDVPTLLDVARQSLGGERSSVAAIASWERLDRATAMDNDAIVVSVGRRNGRSHAELRQSACMSAIVDEAARAGSAPGNGDYRPDRYTTALALAYLRERQPRLLFVGLGDTDEYGHAQSYRGYVGALQALDRFLGALAEELAALGRYGEETTVVLTTDHGWSNEFEDHGGYAPESARIWLVAAGGAVPKRGAIGAARLYHLADVAPTVASWLDLRALGAGGAPIPELLTPPRLARRP